MIRKIPNDAFAYYVSLGTERSYSAVAAKYGVSKRGVQKAATKEDWTARLAHIEAEVRERMDEKLGEGLEEMQTRHLKLLKAVSARAAQALRDNELASAMEGVRAIEMLIKLERTIAGEPGERVAKTVEQVTRAEIDRLVAPVDEPDDDDEDEADDEDW